MKSLSTQELYRLHNKAESRAKRATTVDQYVDAKAEAGVYKTEIMGRQRRAQHLAKMKEKFQWRKLETNTVHTVV